MALKSTYKLALTALIAAVLISCGQRQGTSADSADINIPGAEVVLKDYGNDPVVLDIEAYTLTNENFRTAIWTGTNLQLTVMTIPVGGDIGLEVHYDIDQFLRIEQGEGRVMMGDSEDNLDFTEIVKEDFVVLVPAGKWHNLVNTGDKPLKLYSIYGPAEHPHGTIHRTQADDTGHHH